MLITRSDDGYFGKNPPNRLIKSGFTPANALQRRDQIFHFAFNQIAYFAKLFGRHVAGIRNLPIQPLFGENQRTLVATTHRDGHFDFFPIEAVQPL